MKAQSNIRWLETIILCLVLLPLSANAFYNPTEGRWLSRDLIEESGGSNLSGFVNNSPIDRWDLHGLFFGCSRAQCAGKPYTPSRECCIPGVGIVNRAAVKTAVFRVNFKPPPGTPVFTGHQWLEFPGGSAGYNYLNSAIWRNPDPMSGSTGIGITRTEIKLGPCEYDISLFVLYVQCNASLDIGTRSGAYDCGSYVSEIISLAEDESKYKPGY
jgi:hypothetical protein